MGAPTFFLRSLCAAALLSALAGCAPARPDPQVIKLCHASAITRARGFPVDASDIGELVEACMLNRGFVLRETGPNCGSDLGTALNPVCYHRNTVLGRFYETFGR